MTAPVFLIGGGWDETWRTACFAPFLDIAMRDGQRRIAVVLCVEDEQDAAQASARYTQLFASLGLAPAEFQLIILDADHDLTGDQLAEMHATAILVGGGLTPLYWDILCGEPGWLDYVRVNRLPYAGFSAGAAIAATHAIIGGWQGQQQGDLVPIVDPNCGEDLDEITILPGLGLVPYAVEVHASQWGTLPRAIYAVEAGMVTEAWAVDEDTVLVHLGRVSDVVGGGVAYRVTRDGDGKALVQQYAAGESLP